MQLLAFVLFRYVQTSTDVALTWADPTLICPGYLFNIGAPSVPLSKTTNIEEFNRQQERLEETVAMEEESESRNVVLLTVAVPKRFCVYNSYRLLRQNCWLSISDGVHALQIVFTPVHS